MMTMSLRGLKLCYTTWFKHILFANKICLNQVVCSNEETSCTRNTYLVLEILLISQKDMFFHKYRFLFIFLLLMRTPVAAGIHTYDWKICSFLKRIYFYTNIDDFYLFFCCQEEQVLAGTQYKKPETILIYIYFCQYQKICSFLTKISLHNM